MGKANAAWLYSLHTEFQRELNTKIASGKAPDLIRMLGKEQWMMRNIQPLSASKFDFGDSAWDKCIMDQYTFNGDVYATNLKNSAVLDVYMMYYNKKALKNAELKDPYEIWKKNPADWTWDKFTTEIIMLFLCALSNGILLKRFSSIFYLSV